MAKNITFTSLTIALFTATKTLPIIYKTLYN